MPFAEFQKHLHTKAEIRYSKDLQNYFGWFDYQGNSILVAVSRKLNGKKIPQDAEISLCRYESSCPREPYLRVRHIYLLHRKHTCFSNKRIKDEPYLTYNRPHPSKTYYISPETLKTIDKLKEIFPELEIVSVSEETTQTNPQNNIYYGRKS